MEGSFLRKIEKREKAKEEIKNPSTPEEKDDRETIPEINKDPELSRQFGGFLSTYENPEAREMGMRMLNNTLTEEDVPRLAIFREYFFERKDESEKLAEKIGGERFEEILQNAPQLQDLCNAYGKDKIQEILRLGALELAWSDNKAFEELNTVVTRTERFEQQVEAPLQKEMSEFCKKFKLSEDEVLAGMDSDDPMVRMEQLQGRMREKMKGWSLQLPGFLPIGAGKIIGWGEKAADARGSADRSMESSYGKAWMMAHQKDRWENTVELRNRVLEKQGSFMASFVSSNKDLRFALNRVINGEKPAFKDSITTTGTYEEARSVLNSTSLDEKSAKTLIDEYKAANKLKPISDEAQITRHMGEVFKEAEKRVQTETKRKGGFFMELVRALFSAKDKDEFINNPSMRTMFKGA